MNPNCRKPLHHLAFSHKTSFSPKAYAHIDITMSEYASSSASSPESTVSEEPAIPTMADVIKNYGTEDLIEYLEKKELPFDDEDMEIFRREKITGFEFLETTKQDFRNYGFKEGPATRLVKFIEELKETKLRAFSSYVSLKEVLQKYNLNSDGIGSIPLFELPTSKIKEDEHYDHCIAEILVRIRSYGTLQADSLEAMRNEYVVAILHTALHIVMDKTKKDLKMYPQYEINGEESHGRVDYAIKVLSIISISFFITY